MRSKLFAAAVLAVAALATAAVLRDRSVPDRSPFDPSARRSQPRPAREGGSAGQRASGVELVALDPGRLDGGPPAVGSGREALCDGDAGSTGERLEVRQPTMDELERAASERTPVQDSVFEAEYREWSAARLQTELDSVFHEWSAARRRAFDELFDAGRYELLEEDAEGKPIFDGVGGGVLYSTRVSTEHPGAVQFTVLPPDEYAAIYATGDRWNWLMHATRRAAAD